MKKLYLLFFILLIGNCIFSSDIIPAKSIVLEVKNEYPLTLSNKIFFPRQKQTIKFKILNTKFKNQVFTTLNFLEGQINFDVVYQKGDIVLTNIYIDDDREVSDIIIKDYYRVNTYYVLLIFLVILIILLAGRQGLRAFLALAIVISLIVFFVIPLLLRNFNPVIPGIIFTVVATFITFFLITKDKIIAYSGILGSIAGLLLSFIISFVLSRYLYLDKYYLDIYREILVLSRTHIPLSLKNIMLIFNLTALISAAGIVMDVSIAIASSVREIYLTSENINLQDLFKSGMNIGKDILGTMSNAYVLIFTGQFLPMLIFLRMIRFPLIRILNLQPVVINITIVISGLFGMLVTMSVTSFVSSYLNFKYKKIQ